MEPRPIRDLVGEEICQVQAGSSHCLAGSMGGDLYVWGRGESGQLGLGDRESKQIPVLNAGFPEGTEVSQVAVGENHSLVLTKAGGVYSWGHGDRGRLGVGACWRVGVPQSEKNIFPTPMLLHTFSKEFVRQVSCGPSFCLAVTAANVWSWGAGEGCVLGHGDTLTRETPVQIEAFKGSVVLQAECGTWHCAALVLVPPCKDGGYLYTWGSGYHGQLALGTRQVQPTPTIVAKLLATQQLLRKVWCGSHHCAAVTTDGELYTWGSNRTGCLGRALPDGEQYTADPGHVGGFGVLVDGVGRGLPRAVACGKEFTLVATYPYEGPVMEVAKQVMQASAIEEEEIRLLEEEQLRHQEERREKRSWREGQKWPCGSRGRFRRSYALYARTARAFGRPQLERAFALGATTACRFTLRSTPPKRQPATPLQTPWPSTSLSSRFGVVHSSGCALWVVYYALWVVYYSWSLYFSRVCPRLAAPRPFFGPSGMRYAVRSGSIVLKRGRCCSTQTHIHLRPKSFHRSAG
ncbi:unnamed protein product [Ectocarpus sp. 12 AP-2014]